MPQDYSLFNKAKNKQVTPGTMKSTKVKTKKLLTLKKANNIYAVYHFLCNKIIKLYPLTLISFIEG